ncbi:MAG: hypothetical protein ABR577_02450 [Pyrinomonadaceae bacterium]
MLQVFAWMPWLAFLLVALPLPIYFLLRRLTATEDAGVYVLLFFASLAAGSLVGIVVALLILLYGKRWRRRRRDQLAADGITAAELSWFIPELRPIERRTLKLIEAHNPLLADAYRETLAARLTATRVLANSKRELLQVERRLNQAGYSVETENKLALQKELQLDGERLEAIKQTAQKREAEAESRLQSIEAMAGRSASEAETEMALSRLNAASESVPLGLEAAQLEQEMRQQARAELLRERND